MVPKTNSIHSKGEPTPEVDPEDKLSGSKGPGEAPAPASVLPNSNQETRRRIMIKDNVLACPNCSREKTDSRKRVQFHLNKVPMDG